jgi:hypothetical protein
LRDGPEKNEILSFYGLPPKSYDDHVHKSITVWWHLAVMRGCQLRTVEGMQPNYHYRGEGPWFTSVQLEMLRYDWSVWSGLTSYHFRSELERVVKHMNVSLRPASYYDSNGELFLRPFCCFVGFQPIEEYLYQLEV